MAISKSRHEKILEMLLDKGETAVGRLVKHLAVSEMTIRRDLALLESEGRLERTWGGARLASKQVLDFSFREKSRLNREEKQKIGVRAASLIQPGNYVLLDTGTTTLQVARALRSFSPLTVITCSLPIVSELVDVPQISLIVPGGTVQAKSLEVYGPLTERYFKDMKADIAFIGADAIGSSGELLTTGMETARVSELIIQASRNTVLVADSTKWKMTAPVPFGRLSDVSAVITGRKIGNATGAMIRQSGARLIQV